MIYSLTGKILEKSQTEVVVDCGGVGYAALIPATAVGALPPVGEITTLYTHMNVSENDVSLFGFADTESRAMFRLLTSVSGVGPRVGIAILSALAPETIALAVSAEDFKALTAASGVGPKLAQRIVLELKDKLSASFTAPPGATAFGGGGMPATEAGAARQAAAALASLGYSPTEAAKAIQSIDPALPTAEIIRLALMGLAKK